MARTVTVSLEVGATVYSIDVLYTPAARYRWGEPPDDGELELPDRANDGTTLASIISHMASLEGCYLETAERRIIEIAERACEQDENDYFDDGDS
jgi:hypothetical protein